LNFNHLPLSSDIMQRIDSHVIYFGVDEYDVNSNTRIALLRWSLPRSRTSIPTSRPTFPASRASPARSKTRRACISTACSSVVGATWRRWPRPYRGATTRGFITC
jgi:hypothetical protein